jgi:multimeric flavodoxin WrbA
MPIFIFIRETLFDGRMVLKMLVIVINGSPNPEGNTGRMLKAAMDEVESAGAQTVYMQLSEIMSGQKLPYCIACSTPCKGNCYAGTPLGGAFDLLRRADGIIMGSPVYFSTVSAQLKAFWDKTRKLRKEQALLNVVGGALTVGAARFGGQETTLRAMHDMMLCQGMTVVGDGYREEDAGHQGACAVQPSGDDDSGINRSRILARRVAELAGATMPLRSHRLSLPSGWQG